MRKSIAIMLAIVLALSLAACDSGSTNTPSGGNTTPPAANTPSGNDSTTPPADNPPPKEPETPAVSDDVQVGELITLGQLSWIVLAVEDGKALLLSEKVLESRIFDSSTNDWESSDIRAYLNDAFYEVTFSAQEKEAIAETDVITNGNGTSDKIFLLSAEEVDEYMGDSVHVNIKALRAARGSAGFWWLRSPGYDSDRAADISGNGSVSSYMIGIEGGVRPSLWLNL